MNVVCVQGRCSIVSFGIFTTVGLFAYLWLTQVPGQSPTWAKQF